MHAGRTSIRSSIGRLPRLAILAGFVLCQLTLSLAIPETGEAEEESLPAAITVFSESCSPRGAANAICSRTRTASLYRRAVSLGRFPECGSSARGHRLPCGLCEPLRC